MSDADDPKVKEEEPEQPSAEELLDERLDRLKERATRARLNHARHQQQQSSTLDRETSKGMGVGLSAAYAIIGLPLVGAGVGWLIDRALGTSFVIAIGAIAGLVGGMIHAVQLSNRN